MGRKRYSEIVAKALSNQGTNHYGIYEQPYKSLTEILLLVSFNNFAYRTPKGRINRSINKDRII